MSARIPRARPLESRPVRRGPVGQAITHVADAAPLSVVRPVRIANGRPRLGVTMSCRAGGAAGMRYSHTPSDLRPGTDRGAFLAEGLTAEYAGSSELWAIGDLSSIDAPARTFDTGQLGGAGALTPDTTVTADAAHVYAGTMALRVDPSARAGTPFAVGDKPYTEGQLLPVPGAPSSSTFDATSPANGWVRSWTSTGAAGRYSFAPSSYVASMTDAGAGVLADIASPSFPVVPGQRFVLGAQLTNANVRVYYATRPDFQTADVVAIDSAVTLTAVAHYAGIDVLTGSLEVTVTVPAGALFARVVFLQLGGVGTCTVNVGGSSLLIGAAVLPLGFTADVAADVAASAWVWTQRGLTYRASLRVRSSAPIAPNLLPSPDLTEPAQLDGTTLGWDALYPGVAVALSGVIGAEEGQTLTGPTSIALDAVPVSAGQLISVGARIADVTANTCQLWVFYGNSPGFSYNQRVSAEQAFTRTSSGATWAAVSGVSTVPAGAAYARFVVRQTDAGPAAIAVRQLQLRITEPVSTDTVGLNHYTPIGETVFTGKGGWERVTVAGNVADQYPIGSGNIYMQPDGYGGFEPVTAQPGQSWSPTLQVEGPVAFWLDEVRARTITGLVSITEHLRTDY